MKDTSRETKLPSSSDRRPSFSIDRTHEASQKKAHQELSEIQQQLKSFLSTPERPKEQATQLEGKLNDITQHFKDDSAFGSRDGNFSSQLEEFAKAFREHTEGKTISDDLQRRWQSITQELNKVSGLPEIASIVPSDMTLEEKIEKLRKLREEFKKAKIGKLVSIIDNLGKTYKLKDPENPLQFEKAIDLYIGKKGENSTMRENHENQKFKLGQDFFNYLQSAGKLDDSIKSSKILAEEMINDIIDDQKWEKELSDQTRFIEKNEEFKDKLACRDVNVKKDSREVDESSIGNNLKIYVNYARDNIMKINRGDYETSYNE